MQKALIFDMDGTLFQTDRILELSLDDTFNYLRTQGKWEGKPPLKNIGKLWASHYLKYGKHCCLIIL